MPAFHIKSSSMPYVIDYCIEKVGPRLYYLHMIQGGRDWSICRRTSRLLVYNDKKAIFVALELSEHFS